MVIVRTISASVALGSPKKRMTTQRRTFRVVRGHREDKRHLNDSGRLEQDLETLGGCTVAKTRLHINYVFGCMGQPTFLINLKNKATRRLVESIVKSALGPHVSTSTVDTLLPGEKFAPGLRKSGKRGTGSETPIEATIERHAAQVFRESVGRALLLGVAGNTKSFSYDSRAGLVLTAISPSATTSDRKQDEKEFEVEVEYALEESDCSSSTPPPVPPGSLVQATTDQWAHHSPPNTWPSNAQQPRKTDRLENDRPMDTQRRTFAIAPAQGNPNDQLSLEQALKKLKQCEVVGKKLPMNYLFGCVGHSRFLINLKSKATGRLADSVVKNALGALCEATPFETKQRGEKFVPGRSLRKRGTASSENKRRKGEATIEREAARVFGKCDGVALLLATGGRIDEYQYDSTVGLVLGEKQIQDTGAEDVTAGLDREGQPSHASIIYSDVGGDSDNGSGETSSDSENSGEYMPQVVISQAGIAKWESQPRQVPETESSDAPSALKKNRPESTRDGVDGSLEHKRAVPWTASSLRTTSHRVAMLAGVANFSRAADGNLIAPNDHSQRVGYSSNGDGGPGSCGLDKVEKTRRLSPGMPTKKGLVDRWRKDSSILSSKRGKFCQVSFPADLHSILQQEDSTIIGWLERGPPPSPTTSVASSDLCENAFVIRDPERFCSDIMPRYFSQLHHCSRREYMERFDGCQAERMLWVFEAELRFHDFRKFVTPYNVDGHAMAGYVHPLFKRGRPELLIQITRSITFNRELYSEVVSDGQSRSDNTKSYPLLKLNPKSERASGAQREHRVIFKMGNRRGNSHMWVMERPSATEAADFLSQGCTVEEVVAILSAPTADGGVSKDIGVCGSDPLRHAPLWYRDLLSDRDIGPHTESSGHVSAKASLAHNAFPSQRSIHVERGNTSMFDHRQRSYNVFESHSINDFRQSLQKVLRHLGFQVNEGQDGAERLPRVIFHTAAGIVFGQVSPGIRWGGTSAMSFEECSYDFHQSLRKLPISWRSFLSSIVTCLGSIGQPTRYGDSNVLRRQYGGGPGLESEGGQMTDTVRRPGGKRKRKWNTDHVQHRASLEILKSVMTETLGLDITRSLLEDDHGDDDEAMDAAEATLTMGSMSRAKAQPLFGRDASYVYSATRGSLSAD